MTQDTARSNKGENVEPNEVFVERCSDYQPGRLREAFAPIEPLFDEIVRQGDRVVLKPNWIASHHRYRPEEWESVITHPALITAVVDNVARRLRGQGSIVITDGPQTDSSFEAILERMTVNEWQHTAAAYGVEFSVLDLREMSWQEQGDVIYNRAVLPGDPLGSVEFDLGYYSRFCGHRPSSRGYYGADYDIAETTAAHTGGKHRYKLARTAISADVFINLPKLKTHKKAGITCSLKNLVGINTYKNFLPHHTEGTPASGGDQFPKHSLVTMAEVRLLAQFKRILLRHQKHARLFIPVKKAGKVLFGETRSRIRSGNWYGNDTLWRTILDLNTLLLYGNPDGTLRKPECANQKRYLSIVDGITAGQGNGPEAPDPFPAGLIIAGTNPLSVDCTAAKIMGFDYLKIPSLYQAFRSQHFPLLCCDYQSLRVASRSVPAFNGSLHSIGAEHLYRFRPHFGWQGHVELDKGASNP